jgi:polysaccharide pyruvyl transferase WcaK-like protein
MIRRIGLLNHMGLGNLGDDATQVAVMQNIRARWPHAEFVLISMNPADSSARHGAASCFIRAEFRRYAQAKLNKGTVRDSTAKAFLRRYRFLFAILRAIKTITIRIPARLLEEPRFLGESFKIMRDLDLLIISGGGQLLDAWGGPWKFPYTIFKWTVLAKVARKKCYFLDVGAGPLVHPLGRWFVRNALRLGDYISFRDADSKILIQQIGFMGKTTVVSDCVYALEAKVGGGESTKAAESREVVGLCPMAYCDPRVYWHKDQAIYDSLIRKLASFGQWIGESQFYLKLFSTEISFDFRAIEEVGALLKSKNCQSKERWFEMTYMEDLDQLLSVIYSVDYIVTCRFHGVVFAHLLNKPVLALSHHPKVSTLMRDLGLEKYCLDISKCDLRMVEDAFLSIVAERDEIKARMAYKAKHYRGALIDQFDDVFCHQFDLTLAGDAL